MTRDVFFYGLFMDEAVLRAKGVDPLRPRKAVVPGYRRRIGRRALLVPQFGHQAFGMVFALTEREIGSLYAEPGLELYRPESVVAIFEDATFAAVTTFNLSEVDSTPQVNAEYATKLRLIFERLGFPADQIRRSDMNKQAKNTICLWYNGDAEDAARFYAQTFPDSSVGAVHRAPGDFPSGKKGDVLTVEFTVMGIPCLGLNGGPAFKHSEAFSFQVATADQAETDRYWNAIVGNGGQESACGWCKDKWGLSWQITPIALTKAVTDPDPAVAKRAFAKMMEMRKIDIAAIEAARRG
jgi:predicted 3-demethylubiquinone-9 3-methyltransferase (glyoxalase superfamily)